MTCGSKYSMRGTVLSFLSTRSRVTQIPISELAQILAGPFEWRGTPLHPGGNFFAMAQAPQRAPRRAAVVARIAIPQEQVFHAHGVQPMSASQVHLGRQDARHHVER